MTDKFGRKIVVAEYRSATIRAARIEAARHTVAVSGPADLPAAYRQLRDAEMIVVR